MKTHSPTLSSSASGDTPGVLLTPGLSGSTLFHRALLDAVARFPSLAAADVPTDKRHFKEGFAETLVRFEAHRADSPDRVAMAHALSESLETALHFGTTNASVPLGEHLRTARTEAPKLARLPGGGKKGWLPDVTFHGVRYQGRELARLVEVLRSERHATEAALAGITWTLSQLNADGRLDLSGQRFALLGAGAELAPTEHLVAAGAEVLWLDRRTPDTLSRQLRDFSGRVVTLGAASAAVGSDILAAPEQVRAAVESFSDGSPVHVGLFAYAPGRGRELRLAHAMHAIVKAMGPTTVGSVSMFVSPTTPGEVPEAEQAEIVRRRKVAALWKKALEKARVLGFPGQITVGSTTVSKSVVGLQGATYQAAQYLAKMMAAEALAVDGLHGHPIAVSANVAGITATKSLEHPLFAAAFLGAPRFGIEIFEPATTRVLSGLLMLNDILNPAAPNAAGSSPGRGTPADKGRAVASQAIHGGVRALPWVLDDTIRAGAVLGLGKKPKLVLGLLPKKKTKKKA